MKFKYCKKCVTMSPHQGLSERCMICNVVSVNSKKDTLHWAKKYDEVKHITHHNTMGGGVLCDKYGALLGNNYATTDMPICLACKKNKSLRKILK